MCPHSHPPDMIKQNYPGSYRVLKQYLKKSHLKKAEEVSTGPQTLFSRK